MSEAIIPGSPTGNVAQIPVHNESELLRSIANAKVNSLIAIFCILISAFFNYYLTSQFNTAVYAATEYATLSDKAVFLSQSAAVQGKVLGAAITEGLYAYWPLNEGTGATTADSSGNGSNGSLVGGPAWVDGKLGKALLFSSGKSVNVTDKEFGSTGATYAAWIKTSSDGWVVGKGEGSDLRISGGKLLFQLYTSSGFFNTYSEATVADGQWHHVVATRDGSVIRLYIDGQLNKTGSISGTPNMGFQSIGARNDNSSNGFSGIIDEVYVYNRDLQAGEITQLYQAGTAADTTAPHVEIITPTAGNTLSGSVTVTASASDNVGVAGVQFKIDNTNLGGEDTTSPFSYALDTTSVSNGSHTLTVVARDAAGNTDSDQLVVSVNNQTQTSTVATPTISPNGGTFTSAQSVTLASATSGATIRYTTNGSDPSASSTEYSSPINVSSSLTIKAKAFKVGMTESGVVSATFTINTQPQNTGCPTTVPNNAFLGCYYNNQDFTNFYTSRTDPQVNFNWGSQRVFSGVAFGSDTYSVKWVGNFSFESGNYEFTTLSDDGIRVYVDNALVVNEWNAHSATTTKGTKTLTAGIHEVKVEYFENYGSAVAQLSWVKLAASSQVATPTISPNGGTFTSAQSVTLASATSGATIRYTTNGSDPSASSTEYSSPINVSSSLTIKAKAFKTGLTDSNTATAIFTITPPPPVNTPPVGSLDGVRNDGTIYGWASDPDNTSAAILVHLYFDGPSGSGRTPLVVTAGDNRSDVGDHAFNIPVPTNLRNGVQHSVYAYAIDLTDTSGSLNRLLSGSPKTFVLTTADTAAPSVSITAPVAGATVSGTTSVNVSATDNVGVAGVQFKVDGQNIGSEVTITPFTANFNTTTVSNGTHSLTAVARDAAGNTATSAAVSITVNNVVASAPTITSFAASPSTITVGQSSTLSWVVTGATSLSITNVGTVTGTSKTVSPTTTTTYTLTATNSTGSVTANASVTVNSQNPVPVAGCDFFVATSGATSGNGSATSPWDLQTALNQPASVTPGKTICMKGGTYNGVFTSKLTGAIGNPITLRSAPGEWAIIDANQDVRLAATIDANSIAVNFNVPPTMPDSVTIMVDNEMIQLWGKISPTSYRINARSWSGTVSANHAVGAKVKVYADIFEVKGSDSIYRNFEVTDSRNERTLTASGSNAVDFNQRFTGFNFYAPRSKVINTVVHDTGQGIGFWSQAIDSEIYGNLFYNNGVKAPDRGHGHGIYTQNDSGQKTVGDNITFGNFGGFGMQIYGSSQATLKNYLVSGNINFNNGWLIGGNAPADNMNIDSNYLYGSAIGLGYGNPNNLSATVTNNYVYADTPLEAKWWDRLVVTGNTFYMRQTNSGADMVIYDPASGSKLSNYTINNNKYIFGRSAFDKPFVNSTSAGLKYYSFAEWKALGFDTNSTYIGPTSTNPAPTVPTGTDIFYRANKYEAGRANVIVYNYANAGTVNIDLTRTGLSAGQAFEVRNGQNYKASPIATGTYSGQSVAVNLSALRIAQPVGDSGVSNAEACPQFCVLVVVPTTPGSGNPTPTPAPTITSFTASPSTITAGQTSTLSWQVTGATSLTISGVGSVSGNSTTVSPTATTTYTLTASNATGSVSWTAAVTVNPAQQTQVSAPTISPNGGTFTSAQSVSLASATSGATIRYTTNGSTPTASSTQYTAPFQVSGSATVKAIAIKSGMSDSSVTSSTFTITTADTIAPSVSITAPASGTTISGTSVITTNTSDNVGVVGVQFKVDGQNIGSEVTTSPFSANFNTTTVSNGTHSLTAVARDAAGNSTVSNSVSVNINNTVTPPPTTGACAGANCINLNPSQTYQVIDGWEATAQVGQEDAVTFNTYKNALYDAAIDDLGISRLRVELRSGAENPTNWWSQFRSGQIDNTTWKARRYEIINDDSNPNSITTSGFQWSELDYTLDNVVVPMRQKMQARGKKLDINLNLVDFGVSTFEFKDNPAEFAEFVLAAYQHMQSKYGFVPDYFEPILEPDGATSNWTPTQVGQLIKAAGDRLTTAGFTAKFIAPSTTNGRQILPTNQGGNNWVGKIAAVTGAMQYIDTISYHRYTSPSQLQTQQIAAMAASYGKKTAMLEWIGADYNALHMDIKDGNNSSWQQFTLAYPGTNDNGGNYYMVNDSNGSFYLGSRTKYLRQYFKEVKTGAVRIGASNTGNPFIDPVAFRNTDGKYVVVTPVSSATSFGINGLPAGTYGIFYTTGGSTPTTTTVANQTIASGGQVTVAMPSVGVVTIYAVNTASTGLTTPQQNPVATTPAVSAPTTTPSTQQSQAVTLTPGVSNFKYSSSQTIYFLNSNSQKEAYSEAGVFLAWNKDYSGVVTIPDSQTYPDGGFVRLPVGIVVKGSGPTIYYVNNNNVLNPFATYAGFINEGFTLSQVITISDSYLATYTIR